MPNATLVREPELAPVERARVPQSVYQCIVNVSTEIAQVGIAKTRANTTQGYKFRGIDEVLNALAPLLAKHRLVILPRMVAREMTERQTKQGGVLFSVTVEAEFDFISADDGSKHTVRTFGEAMDSADKATNKAMSAAYKYAAFQTFCIPTEGDDDADSTTHDVVSRPSVQAPAPPLMTGREGERENPATATGGESRATSTPPPGYVYLRNYSFNPNGWHDVMVPDEREPGGVMRCSTKNQTVGDDAAKAFHEHIPVKVTRGKPKGTKPGEFWLDKVELYVEPNHTHPIDDSEVPF